MKLNNANDIINHIVDTLMNISRDIRVADLNNDKATVTNLSSVYRALYDFGTKIAIDMHDDIIATSSQAK